MRADNCGIIWKIEKAVATMTKRYMYKPNVRCTYTAAYCTECMVYAVPITIITNVFVQHINICLYIETHSRLVNRVVYYAVLYTHLLMIATPLGIRTE